MKFSKDLRPFLCTPVLALAACRGCAAGEGPGRGS